MMRTQFLALIFAFFAATLIIIGFYFQNIIGRIKLSRKFKDLLDERLDAQQKTSDSSGIKKKGRRTFPVDENIAANKRKGKLSLDRRIEGAGLNLTDQQFYIFSLVSGLFFGAILYLLLKSVVGLVVGLVLGGLGLPRFYLNYRNNKLQKQFTEKLPGALDIIVRGLRSGSPLRDCIGVIARESESPLKEQFEEVVNSMNFGQSVAQSVRKLADRVGTQEIRFFAIVLTVQEKSGGNLSEVLENLSQILRDRKLMHDKIKSMSMEAKASGVIIASLPFLIGILTYISAPSYIELLWTTHTGKVAMSIGFALMVVGSYVMKKMTDIDV